MHTVLWTYLGGHYGAAITMHAPLESWSMGKSVTAALMGILIKRGDYKLNQPAPIPEWRAPNDSRGKIRIARSFANVQWAADSRAL